MTSSHLPKLADAVRTPVATMRAAVLVAPRRFELHDVPTPDPAPQQVRVRIEGCGVCASSLPLWQGRSWFEYPRDPGDPGHEAWGVVEALGDAVAGRTPGERVALLSYHGFAEFDLVDADHVVPLPAALDGHPFPGEPLGCAMNIFARSEIESAHTVAVVGAGYLGVLLVQLAARSGARVLAISKRTSSLLEARRGGAAETLVLDDPARVARRVRALTGGRGCERVIECAGVQDTLDLAGELTAERARLVIAGYHQDGRRTVDLQQWNWRGLDVVNAHERDPRAYLAGMRAAVRATTEGVLDAEPLVTHTLPLERLNEAFELLERRPEGFVKAVVEP